MTPSVVTTKLAKKKKLRSDLIFMFQIHNPREVTNITKKNNNKKGNIVFYFILLQKLIMFFFSTAQLKTEIFCFLSQV